MSAITVHQNIIFNNGYDTYLCINNIDSKLLKFIMTNPMSFFALDTCDAMCSEKFKPLLNLKPESWTVMRSFGMFLWIIRFRSGMLLMWINSPFWALIDGFHDTVLSYNLLLSWKETRTNESLLDHRHKVEISCVGRVSTRQWWEGKTVMDQSHFIV